MRWEDARNVLCTRLDGLGDVLMTVPAMRALKESLPGRRITLLCSPTGAAAAPQLSEVDEYIVYDAPWIKATSQRFDSRRDHELARRLGLRGFDAAVIFTVYSQNPLPPAMLCYMADIPLRLAHCRENPYQLLTHWVREREPDQLVRHEVRRQLDLVGAIGCKPSHERISIRLGEDIRQSLRRRLEAAGLDFMRPWAVVHPGGSAPSRRYRADGFAAAAATLAREDGWGIVFSGSKDEQLLIEEIRVTMQAPSISLAGELDFESLAALLSWAPVLVTNNTGPAHVAAAVGTAVVDLYALTNPQHTPWGVPSRVLYHDVPCRWCYKSVCPEGHHGCLRLVPPEAIVDAARALVPVRP